MDSETLTHLLRGGHIDMPERIRRGLWPHPPLRLDDVVRHLVILVERHAWFPGTIEQVGLDRPEADGGMTIENRGTGEFVCHFADRSRHVRKRFRSPAEAAEFYVARALHLPGNLDGWRVA